MTMRQTVTFTVPGIPTGKARPRFARMGNFVRTYQPAEDARRENLIALAYLRVTGDALPYDGPVMLSVESRFIPPSSWSGKRRAAAIAGMVYKTSKPDVDNILKSVKDGLNGIAYVDDAQVVNVSAGKGYGVRNEIVVTLDFIRSERIGQSHEDDRM